MLLNTHIPECPTSQETSKEKLSHTEDELRQARGIIDMLADMEAMCD